LNSFNVTISLTEKAIYYKIQWPTCDLFSRNATNSYATARLDTFVNCNRRLDIYVYDVIL